MKIRGQEVLDPRARLMALSVANGDCWEWTGARGRKSGYGHLIVGSRRDGTRRRAKAHRYSYEIFVGAIPDGMWVLHRCDNPGCINPNHLFLGTRQDNVDDRERKGRNRINRGDDGRFREIPEPPK